MTDSDDPATPDDKTSVLGKNTASKLKSEAQNPWRLRRETAHLRSKPDFLVIGAMKSGTSSLYQYLHQHPQLIASSHKEIHYFDGGQYPGADCFEYGDHWYRAFFPLKENLYPNRKTYEVTPVYLFNPLVPGRIAAYHPNVKLVVILRNPTERAISHYFHECRKNRESRELITALREEPDWLQPLADPSDYRKTPFIHYSYKSRGVYHVQLMRFYEKFPANQILVLDNHEMSANPRQFFEVLFDFIGVDPSFQVSVQTHHNTGDNKMPVDNSVRAYLDEFFAPHNRVLKDFLGKIQPWNPNWPV